MIKKIYLKKVGFLGMIYLTLLNFKQKNILP